MSLKNEVYKLLIELFEGDDLRIFLSEGLRAPEELLDSLPGQPVSKAKLVAATRDLLLDYGLVGPPLFDALREARAGRKEDIDRVQEVWRLNPPGPGRRTEQSWFGRWGRWAALGIGLVVVALVGVLIWRAVNEPGDCELAEVGELSSLGGDRRIPRFDMGEGHLGPVVEVLVDSLGRYAVTAGADSIVVIYDLKQRRYINHILLRPVDEAGSLSLALSIDDSVLAVAGPRGFDGSDVYGVVLYDFVPNSPAVRRRIQGLPAPVVDMVFLPDGRHLALGLMDGGVWIVGLAADEELRCVVDESTPVRALAAHATGGLAALHDRSVRSFGFDLEVGQQSSEGMPSNIRPEAMVFSPDGARLSLSYGYSGIVQVREQADLRQQKALLELAPRAIGPVGLSWPAEQSWPTVLTQSGEAVVLDPQAMPAFDDLPEDDPCLQPRRMVGVPGSEDVVIGTCGGGWLRVGPGSSSSKATSCHQGACGGNPLDFLVNDNGESLSAPKPASLNTSGGPAAVLDLAAGTLESIPADGGDLHRPRLESTEIEVAGAGDPAVPVTVNGETPPELVDEPTVAFAMAPTGDAVAISGSLHVYDPKGELRWSRYSAMEAVALNFSGDGRLLLAAYEDGGIRYFRAEDGEPLLQVYISDNNKSWAAWTPTGHIEGSADLAQRIQWQVPGVGGASDRLEAGEGFLRQMHRPGLAALVLRLLDVDAAIEAWEPPKREGAERPNIYIDYPVLDDDAHTIWFRRQMELRFRVASSADLEEVKVRVDGGGGANRWKIAHEDSPGVYRVPIDLGESTAKVLIQIVARAQGTDAQVFVHVTRRVSRPPRVRIEQPEAGVDRFERPEVDLRFAIDLPAGQPLDELLVRHNGQGIFFEVVEEGERRRTQTTLYRSLLQLAPGENQLSIVATSVDQQAEVNRTLLYQQVSAPQIVLTEPSGSRTVVFVGRIPIRFSVVIPPEQSLEGVQIRVNGERITDPRPRTEGYQAVIPLRMGSNAIEILATSGEQIGRKSLEIIRREATAPSIRITSPALVDGVGPQTPFPQVQLKFKVELPEHQGLDGVLVSRQGTNLVAASDPNVFSTTTWKPRGYNVTVPLFVGWNSVTVSAKSEGKTATSTFRVQTTTTAIAPIEIAPVEIDPVRRVPGGMIRDTPLRIALPTVEFIEPSADLVTSNRSLDLLFRVAPQPGGALQLVELLVNGATVNSWRRFSSGDTGTNLRATVLLIPGENDIKIRATSTSNTTKEASITVGLGPH